MKLTKNQTKKSIGHELVFELLSWQDRYVVQTGEDKADHSLIHYSDNGVVCLDGTLVKDRLRELRSMGYKKASCKEGAVVVGSVISCVKGPQLVAEFVQFELSPESKNEFSSYQLVAKAAIRLGKATAGQVMHVRARAEIAKSGSKSHTIVMFDVAP